MPKASILIYFIGMFVSPYIYVAVSMAMFYIGDRRKETNNMIQSNPCSTLAFLLFGALFWPIGIIFSIVCLIIYWLDY